MNWVCRFCQEARNKWTTWFALAMTGLAGLPEVLPQSWDTLAYFVPPQHREKVHHAVLAAGFLGVIWLRIRRDISAAPK